MSERDSTHPDIKTLAQEFADSMLVAAKDERQLNPGEIMKALYLAIYTIAKISGNLANAACNMKMVAGSFEDEAEKLGHTLGSDDGQTRYTTMRNQKLM